MGKFWKVLIAIVGFITGFLFLSSKKDKIKFDKKVKSNKKKLDLISKKTDKVTKDKAKTKSKIKATKSKIKTTKSKIKANKLPPSFKENFEKKYRKKK
tara:strand:+ start:898 stop:1191 length:294 start_codon:yes stop_codon:yes gene_type:complete